MEETALKNLVIIGAGGCGREVLQWARQINAAERRWNIKGFLEYDGHALEGKNAVQKSVAMMTHTRSGMMTSLYVQSVMVRFVKKR